MLGTIHNVEADMTGGFNVHKINPQPKIITIKSTLMQFKRNNLKSNRLGSTMLPLASPTSFQIS